MSQRGPDVIYYTLAIMIVLSGLIAMKLPLGRALKMAAAWIAVFGVFFAIFAFRSSFSSFGQRLQAEALGSAIEDGSEIRIPMSDDGHFWTDVSINGRRARFLIDSGATVTTISRDLAKESGVALDGRRVVINTANGPAPAAQAEADRLEVKSIARTDFPIEINDHDDINILGMNFLSSLRGWRVEGNYLVLQP